MSLTYEDKIRITKTLATVGTGMVAGGTAMHVTNLHPTYRDIDIEAALKVQKGITIRIAPLIGSLVVGLTASGAVYYLSKNRKEDFPWLAGCGILVASFPYTFYFLAPINNRITSGSVSAAEGAAVLKKWRNFAAFRGASTFALFAYFAYLSTKKVDYD